MAKILSDIKNQKITELKKRFYISAVGKEQLLKIIAETEVFEQVFESNAIENSTLTLEETEKILMQIDLDRFVSERELFEAKNLARVVEYIDTKSKQNELTLDLLLLLHKMLISNIRDEIAGRFRSTEWVRVGQYVAPDPAEVIDRLNKLLAEYNGSSEPIATRIARFHLGFELIHPFVDGNGRIGRVLNNFILLREGFVPINIQFVDRQDYYRAFKEFQTEAKITTMENIIATSIINSYYKRLAYLEGKRIITLSEYSKEFKQSHSNLLNKAERQTIEAFVDKGVWRIGV